jgi:hypothetical protein
MWTDGRRNIMSDLISRQAAIDAVIRAEKKGLQGTYYLGVVPSAQPDLDEWCTDCKEYDSERHCCPRYNRVIREAVEEAKKERINCAHCNIINCAHCKRYDRHGHRCKWWNHGVSNVDWCSYAERKDEE